MGMLELIDKCEVVNKLIRLENNYQFYKEKWDADVLYRRICELEIGIGKTHGIELVRCKDCKHYKPRNQSVHWEQTTPCCTRSACLKFPPDGFCSYGEKKTEAFV